MENLGESLRVAMRRVPSPVVVVTAADAEDARGITIGSFTSVSLDPPLISFNVGKEARMYPLIMRADRFLVHILSEAQADLGNHFAVPDLSGAEQFAPVPHHIDAAGTPVLDAVLAVLHCRPYAFVEAGDHAIVVGEVLDVDEGATGRPILY
jgi:flavin reductase (DIM6/NTAB) family NADH-FMN oxidoreductase RutF